MAKNVIQSTVLFANGEVSVAPGAQITIRNSSGLLVPLWLDRDGAQPTSNPFTVDSSGFFRVYADAGRYHVTASQGGQVQEWRDIVTVPEVGDGPLQVPTNEMLAQPEGASRVGYEGGSVADKLSEIVSGAVTEPQISAKIDTHDHDPSAHPELSAFISDEADRAEGAADRAEGASDSAFVNADVYPTVEDGRAAVADGEQFQVLSADGLEYIRYRKDSAAVSPEVARYPSAPALNQIRDGLHPLPDIEDTLLITDEDGSILLRKDGAGNFYAGGLHPEDGQTLQGLGYVTQEEVEGFDYVVIDAEGRVVDSYPRIEAAPAAPLEATLGGCRSSAYQGEWCIQDAIYNQWVWPLFVEANGRIYGGAVGCGLDNYYGTTVPADIKAALVQPWGSAAARSTAPLRGVRNDSPSDDHNAPSTLLDLRPDATKPLVQIQSEHSMLDPRVLSAPVADIGYLTEEADRLPVTPASYAQSFRNPAAPDEVLVVVRTREATSAPWVFVRSLDNGKTWTPSVVFSSELPVRPYVMAKESLDGGGLHIAAHNHPHTGDQTILYMFFSWATGAITFPGDAGTFIPDAFDNPAADPFAYAARFEVFAPTDRPRTRLFDLCEVSPGRVDVVFTQHDGSATSGAWGVYMHTAIDISTATTTTTEVGDCGWPMELPTGGNDYFAGIAIHGVDQLLVAKWSTSSNSDNSEHIGEGTLGRYVLVDGAWAIGETLVTAQNEKVFRPVSIPALTYDALEKRQLQHHGNKVAYVRGRYTTYNSFATAVFFLEV